MGIELIVLQNKHWNLYFIHGWFSSNYFDGSHVRQLIGNMVCLQLNTLYANRGKFASSIPNFNNNVCVWICIVISDIGYSKFNSFFSSLSLTKHEQTIFSANTKTESKKIKAIRKNHWKVIGQRHYRVQKDTIPYDECDESLDIVGASWVIQSCMRMRLNLSALK